MTTKLILFFLLLFTSWAEMAFSREVVFANYFDIPVNSAATTEVTGRIHLERNKDVRTRPIPKKYHFKITAPADPLFQIETRYDAHNRMMGVLSVSKGKSTGARPESYALTVALLNGSEQVCEFPVEVKVVDKTLWQTLYDYYNSRTLSISRLYGRKRLSDTQIEKRISELEQNQGRFRNYPAYTAHPAAYLKTKTINPDNKKMSGTIEQEWQEITHILGALGYAYAKSPIFGPQGDPVKHERLKKALYLGLTTYMNSVPVEGDDVLIDNKPVGPYTGDGFTMLQTHKLIDIQTPTHQWNLTDALITPTVHLMPELVNDIRSGNQQALDLYYANIRYFQLFFSIIERRRPIDDPDNRWGETQDTLSSSGAWSDANLGHRLRTMLALPILWCDYNRPVTYVPYWYSDFYKDKPFKGFSFSPGWSPHGVVSDVAYWLTKFNIPAHHYRQSGFHPDGTVSHHTGHATDAAMHAYGFGWLTEGLMGFEMFKNTDFGVADSHYQFTADRLLQVYPKMFYKNRMDFLVTGRSYLSDMEKFVTNTYLTAVRDLFNAANEHTQLHGAQELRAVAKTIRAGKYESSLTEAFWVNEYLIHRRGAGNKKPFFASVKLKSARTVGAEDFDKVRKSWHCGSGVLLLKVKGDEYKEQTLKNMDFHLLPGITEEWRTDPMPTKGGSQAALPGKNTIAGVLADGQNGLAIYHHLPGETYSSATAWKTYHFINDKILAFGSNIARYKTGQQKDIFTCIDQSALTEPIVYAVNGTVKTVHPKESVTRIEETDQPFWVYTQQKGYFVFPQKRQQLVIKTGKEINTTDRKIANDDPNFILAINHGANPEQSGSNTYLYMMIPNISKEEMQSRARQLMGSVGYSKTPQCGHAICLDNERTAQFAFFKPGKLQINSYEVETDKPAMLIISEEKQNWKIAIGNPEPDVNKKQLVLKTNLKLKSGKYDYTIGGIYPRKGEFVKVEKDEKGGSILIVELPDLRDRVYYDYQEELYGATPIVIQIPR